MALEGDGHLECVQWRDSTGTLTSHDIRHVFLMAGAEANTGRPGVFAVGDVRCGHVKRVASAVGEGSIAVSFVHRVLAE